MSRRAESVLIQRYPQLVRTAYLILAGERRREDRLAKAHRVVQAALPWRTPHDAEPAELYRTLLVRVVRNTVDQPWWLRIPRRPVPLLRAAPSLGDAEHTLLDTALAEAEPMVRAAYALLVAEAAPDREVTELLSEAGIRAPRTAIGAAEVLHDELWDESGLDPNRQSTLLQDAALDPTLARLHPPDLVIRRGAKVATAVVAVAALGFGAVLLTGPESETPTTELARPAPVANVVPANAWRTTSELTLDAWPTRGSRKDDAALRGTAARAWASGEKATALNGTTVGPPAGPVRTLYAGDVDGRTVAVLTDDSRIARYEVSGGKESVTLAPKPRRDAVYNSAIRLTSGKDAARYLLAPWVTRSEVATAGAAWRPLQQTDGLTAPVAGAAGPCWSGPALRLTAAEVAAGKSFTLADFGAATPAQALYLGAGEDAQPMGIDSGDARTTWAKLACPLGALRGITVDTVTTWQVWSGRLPETSADARWICTRADAPGGTSLVTGELLAPEATKPVRTGAVSATRLCSRLTRDLVVVTWWQAPSKQWYLVAAGSENVTRISLTGLQGRTTRRDGLVAIGPFAAPKPKAPVTVKATDERGVTVPVLS